MREYSDRSKMNKDRLIQGELIKFQDKIYRVEISRVGTLKNSHEQVILSPVNSVIIDKETEVVINVF